jgi:hypothetical protein
VLQRFKRAFGCFCHIHIESRIIAWSIHTDSCGFLCFVLILGSVFLFGTLQWQFFVSVVLYDNIVHSCF